MEPFCLGVKLNREERPGSIVPSMAAIMPYTKIAITAAKINIQLSLHARPVLRPMRGLPQSKFSSWCRKNDGSFDLNLVIAGAIGQPKSFQRYRKVRVVRSAEVDGV